MNVIAQRRNLVDGPDDLTHKIARMRSGETNAAHSVDPARCGEKLGEIPPGRRRIAVAVHVLPEQLNFGVSLVHERLGFAHHALTRPATLRASRKRHHAVCTRFVAAFNDGEISSMRIITPGKRSVERL